MECPKEIPDNWPCYILIRYAGSVSQRARNSLCKNYPIHGIYNGSVSGVGEGVNVLEGLWPRDTVIGVLSFDSKRAAQMWYDCTPDIKQFDWLNGVDMVMVPLRKNEGCPHHYIEILDISFKDKDRFYNEYVPQCAKYMQGKPGDVAVVSAENMIKLRGMWDPGFIVINQFKNEADFDCVYRSDDYKPILALRQETSDATVITAELDNIFRHREVCDH